MNVLPIQKTKLKKNFAWGWGWTKGIAGGERTQIIHTVWFPKSKMPLFLESITVMRAWEVGVEREGGEGRMA